MARGLHRPHAHRLEVQQESLPPHRARQPWRTTLTATVAFTPAGFIDEHLKTSSSPSRSTPLRPTILTVDDAKAVRLLTQRALAAFDCDISEAPNGYNALFAMERALPDLILLDVNMPTMGGVEMLTLLRSNPTLAAIPVIMLTSPADHGLMAQLTALGTNGHLMKPFTAATLIEKIRAVINLAPAPAKPA